ncbi:MAG: NUDIX hydrolase [Melioribacteraceae bacterium]|nr:NUDIX hydrolase [Melioribacteraceae bacterium]
MNKKDFNWLEIARELQALAQTGLAFSNDNYDTERYNRLTEIASEITANYSNYDAEVLKEIFLSHPGYATPKIDVRAAVVNDKGELLLVQERTDERWAMPGGWADVGDKPSEVAERETIEESGYIVKAKKLVAVFDANRNGRPMEFFHAFKIIFLCDLIGGEAKTSNETMDAGFFAFNDLPPLSENRTNRKHLDEIKLHLLDSNRLATFD